MNPTMLWLAIVPVAVWLAVFSYMLAIDRKLARLEAALEEDDL